MLLLFQELFVHNGGVFKDCHKVVGLVPGPVVTVETDKGSFKGKKVVLATGAWTNEVLEASKIGIELPIKVVFFLLIIIIIIIYNISVRCFHFHLLLQIYQTEVFYFNAANPEHFAAKDFPNFFEYILEEGKPLGVVYGIPILDIPEKIKVSILSNNICIDWTV